MYLYSWLKIHFSVLRAVIASCSSFQAFIQNTVEWGVIGEEEIWGTEVPQRGPGAAPQWGYGAYGNEAPEAVSIMQCL